MQRFAFACSLLGSILISACGDGAALDSVEPLGTAKGSIVNGTTDMTHAAVVAVLSETTECSGTVVQVSGGNGYVLTAAHCCVAKQLPEIVVFADNYLDMTQTNTFNIVQSSIVQDPTWNENDNTNDFCMFQFSGATAATPVIPVVGPTDDLAEGTNVDFVGYGLTGDPANSSSNNSLRREKSGPIAELTPLLIAYNQSTQGPDPINGGPCEGDSGGPALSTTGPLTVVAVTSAGDAMCTQSGVSGRVSGVYTSFIQPYLAKAPACDTPPCSAGATSSSSSGAASSSGVASSSGAASSSAAASSSTASSGSASSGSGGPSSGSASSSSTVSTSGGGGSGIGLAGSATDAGASGTSTGSGQSVGSGIGGDLPGGDQPRSNEETGGCSIGGGQAGSSAPFGLLLALGILRRRRIARAAKLSK